ncbi:hypothetical protein [Pseudidiomarina mangrovi]|uniref:hypothetical protein n=1 Tax=Pseudidiomarina mangrovi TaxID=2487133 RepID=UPI000FCA7AA7|nr:hypothetical protein [Pseudidiomarina mangrovi]
MPVMKMSPIIYWKDCFDIPIDKSVWSTIDTQPYRRTDDGMTANRDQATFGSLTKGLVLRDECALHRKQKGLYCIATGGFSGGELPPAFYVGIAHGETVLSRLQKHRVKLSGSNVGSSHSSAGGVKHPNTWQKYARERYLTIGGPSDTLADVRFMYGEITDPNQSNKQVLAAFEQAIAQNYKGILEQLLAIFWPNCEITDLTILTSGHGKNNDCSVCSFEI